MPEKIHRQREKNTDLEGAQDQGGKQGGQAGMPKPTPQPGSEEAERPDNASAPEPGGRNVTSR